MMSEKIRMYLGRDADANLLTDEQMDALQIIQSMNKEQLKMVSDVVKDAKLRCSGAADIDFDRLFAVIKERGVTQRFLCDKAGKSRSYIACARVGNGSISKEVAAVFARELGTSVDYLCGKTDDKGYRAGSELSEEQRILIELSNEMTREVLREFISVGRALIAAQK